MNTFFSKIAIIGVIFALLLTTMNDNATYAASAIRVNNQSTIVNVLVYEHSVNPSIGITPQTNAVGYTFIISDQNGRIVKRGMIKSDKTFYIATKELKNGIYRFIIGNHNVQEFKIK